MASRFSSAATTLLVGVALGVFARDLSLRAHAKAPAAGPAASVTVASGLCTRVAPSATAWVTELAQGTNAWLGRLEMAPFAAVPEHRDATEEYIHITQGHGTITLDGTDHAVGPGSTVYMPAGAKVRFRNGAESLQGFQVFAGPAPAAKYDAWSGCR